MAPALCPSTAPVPPPSYHRARQARRLAADHRPHPGHGRAPARPVPPDHPRRPPALPPAAPGGAGRATGPDGRPRVPSRSQQCKRAAAAGALPHELLLILAVREAIRRLTRGRD
jgi:hypothetical protein